MEDHYVVGVVQVLGQCADVLTRQPVSAVHRLSLSVCPVNTVLGGGGTRGEERGGGEGRGKKGGRKGGEPKPYRFVCFQTPVAHLLRHLQEQEMADAIQKLHPIPQCVSFSFSFISPATCLCDACDRERESHASQSAGGTSSEQSTTSNPWLYIYFLPPVCHLLSYRHREILQMEDPSRFIGGCRGNHCVIPQGAQRHNTIGCVIHSSSSETPNLREGGGFTEKGGWMSVILPF